MRLLPRLLVSLLLAGSAPAQTATWIGSAGSGSDLQRLWSDHSSWDTGVVPDGSAATAVFTLASDRAVAITGQPGRAVPLIEESTVTLGSLRYTLPEIPDDQRTGLIIRNNGRLVIQGDGILLDSNATYGVRNDIFVGPAGELELAGNARVQNLREQSGSLHIWLSGDYSREWLLLPAVLRLRDHADLGSAVVGVRTGSLNSINFTDSASAGHSSIHLVYGPASNGVSFTGNSTAAQAVIEAYTISFSGSASAGSARLALASNVALSTLAFTDQSSAGSAILFLGKLGSVYFSGGADAGTATVWLGLGSVVISDNARTSGLSITSSDAGRLDISRASQDVELRAVNSPLRIELGARSLRFTDAGLGTPDSRLAGKISGSGGITWDRPATLIIANPGNDFTGTTSVLQGTLLLDHGRVSDLVIGAAASLTGVGQVGGSLHNNGVVSPGNSPGTITIGGDYTQTTSGRLDVEITSSTEHDRLNIAGTANLDGTLAISFLNDYVPVGDTAFYFLNAGSITGRFATVNLPPDTSAALSNQVQYTSTGVRLVVTQHPFASFAGTPAGTALGAHLDDTLAGSTGSHRTFLTHLNSLSESSHVSTALDALVPDRYAALPEENLYGALLRNAAHDARLVAARRQSERGLTLFFDAARRETRFDASNGLPEAGATTDGGTAGVWWRNESHLLGIAVTQEDIALELDALGSRADSKLLAPTLTYQFVGDGFFLNASASSARSKHDLKRIIRYPGIDSAAIATTNSRHTIVTASIGRTFQTGAWALTPQASLIQSDWSADGFTESGYGSLAVPTWSLRSLHVRAGFEASRHGDGFTPTLAVSWLHEADRTQSFRAGFANTSARYTAPGRETEGNLLSARFSLEKSLSRHAVFTASIGGLWGRDARINTDLSAGFRWEF